MRTLQPALKNGRYVWDRIHVPEAEFRRRVAAVRERMRVENIDVLLAYGRGYDRYANATYLSNHINRLPMGLMVRVDPNRVTMLFEGASRGIPSIRKITWIQDIVAAGMDMAKTLPGYFEENPVAGDTVGLAGVEELMPFDQYEIITNAFKDKKIKDAGSILEDCRKKKSPAELDQIRRAGRLIGRTLASLGEFRPQGKTDRALEACLFHEARLEGAEDVRVLFGFPRKRGWSLRPSQNDPLETGQVVVIYLAAAYEHYWAEAASTYVVGDDALAPHGHEAGSRILNTLRQSLATGERAAEYYRKALKEIEGPGLSLVDDYGLMQGIGLSLEEAPFFGENAEGAIEPGMCFSIRLPLKDEKTGTVMTGTTVAVTENGIEDLIRPE